MKVKTVYESWEKMPGRYIIETMTGVLKILDIRKVFRKVTEKNLKPYHGDIRALGAGSAISEAKLYIYRFYGLEKE